MSPEVWISVAVVVIVLGFVVWLLLREASVVVQPGTLGLIIRRGKATGRALSPGRHFVTPFRQFAIQTYPSRELALLVGTEDANRDGVDHAAPPIPVHLGDRSEATLSFTVRCRLRRKQVQEVHDRFGPEGIWSVLRDTTRRSVITAAADDSIDLDAAFGTGFAAAEQHLAEAVDRALSEIGFEMTMFNLRRVDLGQTGDVIQATRRAEVELDLERALADLRRARIEHDNDLQPLLASIGDDHLLRYRQLEAWRDLLHRWDGVTPIPPSLTAPLLSGSASASGGDAAAGEVVGEVQPPTSDAEPTS